jgi:hypothetical protein
MGCKFVQSLNEPRVLSGSYSARALDEPVRWPGSLYAMVFAEG